MVNHYRTYVILWQKEDSTEAPFKVLHLSDFHYDPLYKEGTNADCDLPLCCEEENGPPVVPEKAAGFWGDYRVCDTPWRAVTNLMDHVTEQGVRSWYTLFL